MLYLYLYALVKQMLWLCLLDAVGPPAEKYDSVNGCAGATSGHAMKTHAGANKKVTD